MTLYYKCSIIEVMIYEYYLDFVKSIDEEIALISSDVLSITYPIENVKGLRMKVEGLRRARDIANRIINKYERDEIYE